MARDDPKNFRIIQPNDKGYSGMTGFTMRNGKEVVMMGVGADVEAALVRFSKKAS